MPGIYFGTRGEPSIGGSKSNSQVIHIWAQGEGKEARGGNIRCADNRLYSYRTVIARWYDMPRKQRCVVITEKSYSVTTSGKHMPGANDIPPGIEVYYFPGDVDNLPDDWKSARVELLKAKQAQLGPMLETLRKARDVREYDLARPVGFAQEILNFATANGLRSHLRKDTRILNSEMSQADPFAWIRSFDPALADRCARQFEKTAERDKANRTKREREQAERARLLAATREERVAKFRAGESYGSLWDVPTMLRINGNEIETSRGARITIDEARRFFPALHTRSIRSGERVGHFAFERVERDDAVIGCHTIPLVEIYRIAAELGMINVEESPLTQ